MLLQVCAVKAWKSAFNLKMMQPLNVYREGRLADGLHVIIGSKNNMQIMLPLTIPQELLDEGLDILTAYLKGGAEFTVSLQTT